MIRPACLRVHYSILEGVRSLPIQTWPDWWSMTKTLLLLVDSRAQLWNIERGGELESGKNRSFLKHVAKSPYEAKRLLVLYISPGLQTRESDILS